MITPDCVMNEVNKLVGFPEVVSIEIEEYKSLIFKVKKEHPSYQHIDTLGNIFHNFIIIGSQIV